MLFDSFDPNQLDLDWPIEPPPRPGMVVDHIDRDTMNNTRANFRWATLSQNRRNR